VARKVTRDIDEDVRDRVRALATTEAFQQITPRAQEDRDAICAYEAHLHGSTGFDCGA
jgi:hypothetical protein